MSNATTLDKGKKVFLADGTAGIALSIANTSSNTETMTIDGAGNITTSGAVTAGSIIDGAGAVHLTSTFENDGAVNFNSTLDVDGAATLASAVIEGAATVGTTLGVTGATTLSSTLGAGATTVTTLHATGAATLDSTLGAGATTVTTLHATGAATLDSTLSAGATTVTTLQATSTINVDGAATLASIVCEAGATIATTLAVTGTTTPTGGIVPIGGVTRVYTGGFVPDSLTTGTDTTPSAGRIDYQEAFVPANKTFTGIALLNGSVVGTHKVIVGVYTAAGVLIASSALAGTDTTDDAAFEKIAFTAPVAIVGPQRVWLALQFEGTTPRYRASIVNGALSGTQAGAFGTMATISSPSTTEAAGPILYMY